MGQALKTQDSTHFHVSEFPISQTRTEWIQKKKKKINFQRMQSVLTRGQFSTVNFVLFMCVTVVTEALDI